MQLAVNTTENFETEERLLEVAGEVFAEHGFKGATIREICARAGTNVASINYHFGDKASLYARVLKYSHDVALAQYPPLPQHAKKLNANEKLYHFVSNFLGRLITKGKSTWHGRLLSRELMEPTPALNELIESGIKPHFAMLCSIIEELSLNTDTQRCAQEKIALCAGSVIGQCFHYHHARYVIGQLAPNLLLTDETREQIARHITEITIFGINPERSSPCTG